MRTLSLFSVQFMQIIDKPINGFDLHPCHTVFIGDKAVVETCEESEAEFWSVYAHLKEGGLECIADFEFKSTAEFFYEFVNSIKNNLT